MVALCLSIKHRRYQIVSILSVCIVCLLLSCLNAASWRTIESKDRQILARFYLPLRYDLLRSFSHDNNRTFQLSIGPLWRCLTTPLTHDVQTIVIRECTVNNDSFDYGLIAIGIGTLIVFTTLSLSLINSNCLSSHQLMIRLLMSFILELASLWLLYGFFHVQRIFGPLYGWASIGYFVGTIGVIIICVLEWDDYFRDLCRDDRSTDDRTREQIINI
jgi:hypothetical protein